MDKLCINSQLTKLARKNSTQIMKLFRNPGPIFLC